ncbi:hypothetical protein GALMADRAFT_1211592 [Galerina marginata CBS 339.88]|uniref:Uncharacterized protein n=1 Tax=Galerina marginata (strain CBS 339.88) TaxID=685588 RepID=A0A067SE25_GALM3|nr:hypothetical protein GALMADRAFT_1211592 [Galerina marginata CBS 339.88]
MVSYSRTSTQHIPHPTQQAASYSGHSSSHTLPARSAVDDIFSNPINCGPPSNHIHNCVPLQAQLMASSPIESSSSPLTSHINPLRYILCVCV